MDLKLSIRNGDKLHLPPVEGSMTLTLSRRGSPGQLSFNVLEADFTQGNAVQLEVDGVPLFLGYIFTKKRTKQGIIQVTAYDQLRYLKNSDSYRYTGTLANLVRMIADDFHLKTGYLEDSGFVIADRKEDGKTLFDIIQTAIEFTAESTGRLYCLYDDYGDLTLRDVANMKLNLLVDSDTAEDYDYTTTIDGQTYNKIKLTYDNEETGTRDVYIANDAPNISKWGVLQYYDSVQSNASIKTPKEDGTGTETKKVLTIDLQAKANVLLNMYNRKTRTLTVKNAFGDPRVRAGCLLPVHLELDDISVQNFMLAETVKHTFSNEQHSMDLSLRGGEFVA